VLAFGAVAGGVGGVVVKSGECVRINTGAPLPPGTDAVIQVILTFASRNKFN